jgi:hypothetical protein
VHAYARDHPAGKRQIAIDESDRLVLAAVAQGAGELCARDTRSVNDDALLLPAAQVQPLARQCAAADDVQQRECRENHDCAGGHGAAQGEPVERSEQHARDQHGECASEQHARGDEAEDCAVGAKRDQHGGGQQCRGDVQQEWNLRGISDRAALERESEEQRQRHRQHVRGEGDKYLGDTRQSSRATRATFQQSRGHGGPALLGSTTVLACLRQPTKASRGIRLGQRASKVNPPAGSALKLRSVRHILPTASAGKTHGVRMTARSYSPTGERACVTRKSGRNFCRESTQILRALLL